jgi:hypothetical protein
VVLGGSLGVRYCTARVVPASLSDREFWAMVASFSEPEGVFHSSGGYRSDNLISNERSVQQVIPDLQSTKRPGAYLGVGPEQNFTYITALKPTIAFIIDIRRQNMLLHLLYKALVEISGDRVDFLSRLFARQAPASMGRDSRPQALFAAFKAIPVSDEFAQATVPAVLDRLERIHGFRLSHADETSISEVYRSFYAGGPDLRWDPDGGSWIPSYAELMAGTDLRGREHSYLASEENFQILKEYETTNRIVPLVGDFGGDRAIRAVGGYLKDRGATVTTFYVSNVEGYLRGEGPRKFIRNVSALPLDAHSMFIRTMFMRVRSAEIRPDYETSTVAAPIAEWLSRHAIVD